MSCQPDVCACLKGALPLLSLLHPCISPFSDTFSLVHCISQSSPERLSQEDVHTALWEGVTGELALVVAGAEQAPEGCLQAVGATLPKSDAPGQQKVGKYGEDGQAFEVNVAYAGPKTGARRCPEYNRRQSGAQEAAH